ncbi:hypothetical protein MKW98_020238 [Papaver atlanticum]|uniref:Peptidase A1 domain-containing protein n=1 Tax=Papaver atlanticum TaxID=357466 RepID=A0AAD4S9W9_9MAGN|nr:hypothetical protein MKW98_020238 [Papaver atlanticum]
MASRFSSFMVQHLLLFHFCFHCFSDAQPSLNYTSRPRSIVFKIEKDPLTLQYMIKINQGTPRAAVKLVLDLGGKLPWLRCHKGYKSSSYRPVNCMSPQCALASKPIKCVLCNSTTSWCHSNACNISTTNPITQCVGNGELITDVVTVESNKVQRFMPRVFAFGCATTSNFLHGLAKGAKGVAGLGRSSPLSLISQFSVAFRFSRIFALILDDRFYNSGGGRYHVTYNGDDVGSLLSYTPLLINPKSSEEYFIDLKSIEIIGSSDDGKAVPIHQKLLSINKKTGVGGTKVSLQVPYTTMETSIYKAFVSTYLKKAEALNPELQRVASVAPFDVCFNASTTILDYTFLVMPSIHLVFSKNLTWFFTGLQTLVEVNSDVLCLGFIDGGSNPMTSIVIGTDLYKYNLVEFDIAKSRFGFWKYKYISGIPI